MFFIFGSCHDDSVTFELPDGTYTGIFTRSNPHARFLTSTVVLTFNDHNFEGSSSIENYPSICKGSYKIIGNDIEFTDSCTWTADFDWSFILSGNFNISMSGAELLITRSYDGKVTDTYSLKRQ
jgi:hypothetical protein